MTKDANPAKEPVEKDGKPTPGLDLEQHTELVSLGMQRAASTMEAAAKVDDDKEASSLVLEAYALARRALDSVHFDGVQLDGRSLAKGAADALLVAIRDVEGRRSNAGLSGKLAELRGNLLDKFGSVGLADAVSPRDRDNHRVAAQRAGLLTLTISEKVTLGRYLLKAAEQRILDGWTRLAADEGDSYLLAAQESLGEARDVLGDPSTLGHRDELEGDVARMEDVLDRLLIQYEGRGHVASRSVGMVGHIAGELDRVIQLARESKTLDGKWYKRALALEHR